MEKSYTYSQLEVWRSAMNISEKIFNLTNYFPEDAPHLAETIRTKAKTLPTLVAAEFMEEAHLKVLSNYQKSLELLNLLEEKLIHAFDQGCITERELKTTLEATDIYSHHLKSYQNSRKGKHHLVNHLEEKSQKQLDNYQV